MSKIRRSFSDEFKAEAVRQVTELGRPIGQVARELSLRPEQVRVWKQQLIARGAAGAPVRVETAEEEVRRLRRELAVLRQEHEFLGKAAVDSMGQCNCLSNRSAGVSKSSVLRGRLLSFAAMASRSSWVSAPMLLPFGKY